jgi:hypothetical protein
MSFEIEVLVDGESLDVFVDALPPVSTALFLGGEYPMCLVTCHNLNVTEDGTSKYSVFARRVGQS